MLNWIRRRAELLKPQPISDDEPRSYCLAPGERVYAIGDVHGRFDLLFALLGKIKQQDAARSPARTTVVILGDMIDRGPHSSTVVQFFSRWNRSWAKLIVLKGNHEDKLVRLLEGESVRLGDWLGMGGSETLRSYGVGDDVIRTARTGELIDTARAAIPSSQQSWLRGLPSRWQCGDYLFVHAGVKPGVAILAQHEHDIMAIRGEFLDSKADHGCVVVHGHSIEAQVEDRANRIGIDTGAWRSGRLTAVGIEGSERWFLTEVGAPRADHEPSN